MQSTATTVDDYFREVPAERVESFTRLRETILKHIPSGFEEQMNYGMIGYVVPHSLYPAGYHCNPSDPLPFANIASQKHFIGFYHMGIYAQPDLLKWFVDAYPIHTSHKLDMGKSCIRFKKMNDIPYALVGELMSKMTPDDWIEVYENNFKQKRKK